MRLQENDCWRWILIFNRVVGNISKNGGEEIEGDCDSQRNYSFERSGL